MCRFIETMCIKNGEIDLICFHNKRLNETRFEIFGEKAPLNILDFVDMSPNDHKGTYKCRILYDKKITDIQITDYTPRKISSLQLVYCDNIEYRYKAEDRSVLGRLYEQRKEADDIVIVKNGFITDTSYSNLVFYDGSNWFTPSEPLLNGVQRQFLLSSGKVKARSITPADLPYFESARLINAMLDFDNAPEIEISKIIK